MIYNCPICKKLLPKINDNHIKCPGGKNGYHFSMGANLSYAVEDYSSPYNSYIYFYISHTLNMFYDFRSNQLTLGNSVYSNYLLNIEDFNLENFDRTLNKLKILLIFK